LIDARGISVDFVYLAARDQNIKRSAMNRAMRRREQQRVVNALREVDFRVGDGERLGLLGANGAGKTTLLRVIAGVLMPTQGRMWVSGRVLSLLGGANLGLDPEASGRENAETLGIQLGLRGQEVNRVANEAIEFSGLGARISDPVYTYSSGMMARLRFSVITGLRPEVLVLDEGIGAADAAFAQRAADRMASFVQGSGSVVIASHSLGLLRATCNRGMVLEAGSVAYEGTLGGAERAYMQSVGSTLMSSTSVGSTSVGSTSVGGAVTSPA
jgi:ABC-type polysaccharide/polyol phosphate transport system ATPase subunit